MLAGSKDLRFDGVGIDSRTIAPGGLFVAICGENHDGHDFVEQVVSRGVRGLVVREDRAGRLDLADLGKRDVACVAVADTTRALGALAHRQRRRFEIPVVAVTGSNGKTTTRSMTSLVMAGRYDTLSTQGNFNNEIGLPLTLFGLEDHHQAVVVELGMNHFGEMDRLGAICSPTIGVITNVAACHIEYLGSLEGIARAKGELVTHVDPAGTLVLNADDPLVAALAEQAACKVLFFGLSKQAAVRAEGVHGTADSLAFELLLPGERIGVQLKTPGRFMVFNALAAAAVGHLAGLNGSEIKQGLEAFTPVKGRLNIARTDAGVNLIDDTYNANPGSVAAAIETVAALKAGAPAFIVLGDMLELGGEAENLHRQVGRQAAMARPLRLYAHGPCADHVAEGAVAAGMRPDDILVGAKETIADDLAQRLTPGCWVLVKGSRGMAMETVAEAVRTWRTSPGNE